MGQAKTVCFVSAMVRIKKRYILVRWRTPKKESLVKGTTKESKNFAEICLKETVRHYVLYNFGYFGWGCLKRLFGISYINLETKMAIFICSPANYEILSTTLPLITLIVRPKEDPSQAIRFDTIHVSGTIKKCNLAL